MAHREHSLPSGVLSRVLRTPCLHPVLCTPKGAASHNVLYLLPDVSRFPLPVSPFPRLSINACSPLLVTPATQHLALNSLGLARDALPAHERPLRRSLDPTVDGFAHLDVRAVPRSGVEETCQWTLDREVVIVVLALECDLASLEPRLTAGDTDDIFSLHRWLTGHDWGSKGFEVTVLEGAVA